MSKMPKKEIQRMLELMIRQDEEDRKLVTSPEYLKWLISFTNDCDVVNASALEFYKNYLTAEDKKNVEKLPILFHIIKCYAEGEGIRQEIQLLNSPYENGAKYLFTMQMKDEKFYFLIGYHEVNITRLFLKRLSQEEFEAYHVEEINLQRAIETYQEFF